jgi:hypothetical protein
MVQLDIIDTIGSGIRRERFDGGWFSPVMVGAVHAFHAWVARQMSEATGVIEVV